MSLELEQREREARVGWGKGRHRGEELRRRSRRSARRGGLFAVWRWVANVFRWNLNAISRAPESLDDLGVGIEGGDTLCLLFTMLRVRKR